MEQTDEGGRAKWYQPSLDQGVAYCGSCGRETEYDGRSWKCQECPVHDERT